MDVPTIAAWVALLGVIAAAVGLPVVFAWRTGAALERADRQAPRSAAARLCGTVGRCLFVCCALLGERRRGNTLARLSPRTVFSAETYVV